MTPIYGIQDVATFVAFFQQGLLENNKDELIQKNSQHGESYLALIADLSYYAPTLVAMANAAAESVNDDTLNGPIEYTVCEEFGQWYGKCVIGDETWGQPTRNSALSCLRELVAEYFFEIHSDLDKREAIVSALEGIEFTDVEDLIANAPSKSVIKTAEDRMSDWLLSNVSNVTDITHEEISAKQIEFLLAEVGELRTAVRTPLLLPLIALNDDVRGHVAWLRDNFCDGEQEMRVADALDALTSSTKEQAKTNEGFVLAFPGASDAEAEELVNTLKHGGNTVVRISNPIVEQAALGVALDDLGLEAGELNSSASLHL